MNMSQVAQCATTMSLIPMFAIFSLILSAQAGSGATAATCLTGEQRPPSWMWGSEWREGVIYYTFVDSTECTCIGGDFVIDYVTFTTFVHENCRNQIAVSLVGAMGTAACPVPDTTAILSSQQVFEVEFTYGPVYGGGAVKFTVPLPVPMVLPGPAFLKYEIVSTTCGDPGTGMGMISPCIPCRTYWRTPRYEVTWTSPQDGCGWLLQGNAAVGAGNSCGIPVSVRHGSWGGLKVIYR